MNDSYESFSAFPSSSASALASPSLGQNQNEGWLASDFDDLLFNRSRRPPLQLQTFKFDVALQKTTKKRTNDKTNKNKLWIYRNEGWL